MEKLQVNFFDERYLTPVEVYQHVLDGKTERFPPRFWKEPDAAENAVLILRFLLESILRWSPEEIKKNFSINMLADYKLAGMLTRVFRNDAFQALNMAYPNQFREWELRKVYVKSWSKEMGIQATKWLIEEKLTWTENDVREKIGRKVFEENGLSGMLAKLYSGSARKAVQEAYPDKFEKLKKVATIFWSDERVEQTITSLLGDKLARHEKRFKENRNAKAFINGELSEMLKIYDYNTWQTIHRDYPDWFCNDEAQKFPIYFWNAETGKQATKWLVEEKLMWTKNEIKDKISKKVFVDNGLAGMLNGVYNGSPWKAINAVYPDQFKEWEMRKAPVSFWNDQTRIQATKWLVEEKLKWTDREIKAFLQVQTFKDFGLYTMIRKGYSNNIYKALDAAYPGRFQQKDFEKGWSRINSYKQGLYDR